MRIFIIALIALMQFASAATLKVLNWSDYIDESFLERFSKKYDVEIDYQTYGDVDEFEYKYILGDTQFDVVFPPLDSLSIMIERELAKPLNKALLPNIRYVDKDQLERMADYDEGNTYALPYLWGTTAIGINVDQVKQALRVDEIPNSWDLLFDPDYAKALTGCGISWLDSEVEMLPLSLNYIGINPRSSERADFRAAQEHLSSVSPFVTTFDSENYLGPFRDGELCAVIGYSGDIYQAIDEASEAENGQNLQYIIPREGAPIWFDIVTITSKDNVKLAHAFLNELMQPENIAGVTNYVWYANAVKASLPFIDDEIKNDPSIYPDDETYSKLFSYPIYNDRSLRTMSRRWSVVKCASGQECAVPLEAMPGQ